MQVAGQSSTGSCILLTNLATGMPTTFCSLPRVLVVSQARFQLRRHRQSKMACRGVMVEGFRCQCRHWPAIHRHARPRRSRRRRQLCAELHRPPLLRASCLALEIAAGAKRRRTGLKAPGLDKCSVLRPGRLDGWSGHRGWRLSCGRWKVCSEKQEGGESKKSFGYCASGLCGRR